MKWTTLPKGKRGELFRVVKEWQEDLQDSYYRANASREGTALFEKRDI